MRDYPMLPVYGGPLDGEEVRYSPTGYYLQVTRWAVHKYLLRQDADGSRYWGHYEVVPLTRSVNAA